MVTAHRRKVAEVQRIEAKGPAPDRGRIEPPAHGRGAMLSGAPLHLMCQAAGQLDRDAWGLVAPARALIEAELAIFGRHLCTPGCPVQLADRNARLPAPTPGRAADDANLSGTFSSPLARKTNPPAN